MKHYKIGIFGCGDFLRWQASGIKSSESLEVAALYDPDKVRAEKFAADLGGHAVEDGDAIFADDSIDIVALFVPPWIRKDLFLKATQTGKHVIATKPLGSTPEDCETMLSAAQQSGIKAGLIYARTDNGMVEALKNLFLDGRYGKLALYRHDWLHAYPQWNAWAVDPEKNGGPFMDAMIHNLNAACYLMDRPVSGLHFFSDRLAHPDLKCADTESMVVRFGDGVANLFITWAADLASNDTSGNNREHIDIFYLVTDKGYHITAVEKDGKPALRISREGQVEHLPIPPLEESAYQAFCKHLDGGDFPRRLATLEEATRDIRLVRSEQS